MNKDGKADISLICDDDHVNTVHAPVEALVLDIETNHKLDWFTNVCNVIDGFLFDGIRTEEVNHK